MVGWIESRASQKVNEFLSSSYRIKVQPILLNVKTTNASWSYSFDNIILFPSLSSRDLIVDGFPEIPPQ